jgi:hypothetical protein
MQFSTASHGMAWHGMASLCVLVPVEGLPPSLELWVVQSTDQDFVHATGTTLPQRSAVPAALLRPVALSASHLPACMRASAGAARDSGVAALPPIESANCRCVCTATVGQALVLSLRVLGVEMPSPSVLMPKPLTFGHVAICVRACAAPGHTHTHKHTHTSAQAHRNTKHARWRPRVRRPYAC